MKFLMHRHSGLGFFWVYRNRKIDLLECSDVLDSVHRKVPNGSDQSTRVAEDVNSWVLSLDILDISRSADKGNFGRVRDASVFSNLRASKVSFNSSCFRDRNVSDEASVHKNWIQLLIWWSQYDRFVSVHSEFGKHGRNVRVVRQVGHDST